jgi:tripartite motif-containing protein 71
MSRGEAARRGQFVLFFLLLLTLCVAAPVLAETSPSEEAPPPAEGEGAEVSAPLELLREESLETPQAVAEREDSEYAFADLTPAEEGALLQEHFAAQLEAIDADPARALADVAIEELHSPTEALVTLEGEKALLESEVPLRTPEEDGDLGKVELELEETPSGFEPANPLVDLILPDSAQDPIEIGDEGLAITPVGTSDAPATPVGGEDLLLPAAREDTSLLLSPIAGGVELSALLASRNAPQQLAFDVDLPQGARLQAEPSGGAMVLDAAGELIAMVSAPRALDAQGTTVPATLTVEGSTLAIAVPHQELDVAYPLFVDPEITEDITWANNLNHWTWAYSGVGAEDFIGMRGCIPNATCWGGGLYVRGRSNFWYPGGSWARWWFVPKGATTYIRRAVLGPINYDAHGCWANEPHPYVGVLNDNGSWVVRNNAFPSGWLSNLDVSNLPPGSRAAFVGIHAEWGSTLNCGRDYRLGGAVFYLDDPENPTAHAASGYPTGWVKDGVTFTVNTPASDPGVGVRRATFNPEHAPPREQVHSCTGHYVNPCPADHTFQFSIGSDSFDEGEKLVRFSAEDALGKGSNTQQWNMKVDRTPPEIELSGQLAQATDEAGSDEQDDKDKPLPLPVYNLTVNATDGVLSPANGGQKRSGVKKIQVFIDDKSTPEQTWEASSCSAGNCPLSKVFTLKLNELSAGAEHKLRVYATDFAGNTPRKREIEFEYIPATGMKDEYVQQYFPLPDGSGDEAEEEHPSRPELAVNLVSGNLVYRQEDLDVTGPAADLELELFYNSLLPEQQDTEWGDGWTLAQTPALEIEDPGAGPPTEATIVDESAMVESKVDLPTGTGEEEFDKRLQATVTKEAGGEYAITDESGETGETITFSASGRAEELSNGTSGTVDYSYEEGDLAEIVVEDPGTANVDPESIEEGTDSAALAFLHSANFGSFGAGDGQLKNPSDVLVDAQGNLLVLDKTNGRIQKFGPDGQFVSKFGSPGSGNGQLESPAAFALDGAGNVLLLETGRVQKLSPTGTFLAKFGSIGIGDGQILLPAGITVGADGSIWTASHNRVQRFTAGGQFIERVGGSGEGQLSWPQSLDTAPNGDVYVADSDLDRVLVFDEDGDYVRQLGEGGTGPGQLSNPTEVDVDDEGRVWVADAASNHVQAYTAAGDFIAEFGSTGSGAEQLALEAQSGLAVAMGRVWIADPGNDRLSRWLATSTSAFLHSSNFGSFGSADGELKAPADVVTDSQGNLFVLDRGNSRIEKFGPDGQFLAKFGSAGSGDGQLNSPSAIALDAAGNVLVAENHRVQKLSPSGGFLSKFGSIGTGNGQFLTGPTGIAVAADGSIWVSDLSKVQRFTAGGQYIERIGASGPGQISLAESLAAAPSGEVLIADPSLDRVKAYSAEGDFLRAFGASGTGPGQLAKPVELDVDSEGQVWVGDEETGRVQVFTAAGDYVAGFGGPGSGSAQLDLEQRSGIAVEAGRVWIADAGNDRMGEWVGGNYEPSSEPVLSEDDPQLEVEVSDGLVDSVEVANVEGEEGGSIDYEHDGDLLTAVDAPEGGAEFDYDGKGRMTKVTLANGTYGEVTYEATYGRVESVTVAVEGANPKTTHFNYSDEPRRTTVVPSDAAVTTYDIAADGSIFKWWNTKQPPVFDDLAGSLYDPNNRETSTPIPTGVHNLVIQAHDDEGIASIQVIANGDQLVDEKTCEFPTEPSKCSTLTNEWVTETANWPPGIVHLEVIATDRLGEAISQRFWINIPYTPPPDPEAEEPPRFNDILRFREEFGLDLDLKGDEFAINDRIFELMGDWNNPNTPAGEVARVTGAKWGVPLRSVDVAELEFREHYVEHAAVALPDWAASHSVGYAGYYVNHRQGGLVHVGFTSNQEDHLAQLITTGVLSVPPDRLKTFPGQPQHPLSALESLQVAITEHSAGAGEITRVGIDVENNVVSVGATDEAKAKSVLAGAFGSQAPVSAYADSFNIIPRRRERFEGPVKAGDLLRSEPVGECTAGYGAWDTGGSNATTGAPVFRHFLLSAGHCFDEGWLAYRWQLTSNGSQIVGKNDLGYFRRSGYRKTGSGFVVDAIAARLESASLAPRLIYHTWDQSIRVREPKVPQPGMIVCFSGVTSDHTRCGPVLGPAEAFPYFANGPKMWQVPFKEYSRGGDSGGPVWEAGTGRAIGLLTAGAEPQNPNEVPPKESAITALLPSAGRPAAPGILAALGTPTDNLKLVRWK